jgi:hypothetical protein
MALRHDLGAYGPRLTVQQAGILRGLLHGPEGEATFLTVVRDAPTETLRSQLPEVRAMIGRALEDPSDRLRYLAGVAAASRYAELAADADLLSTIRKDLATTVDSSAKKALMRAAERLESRLYGTLGD